ncbi:MAG: 50S ribosomal protein L39e [Candidatus Micrarchaeota archaeon]
MGAKGLTKKMRLGKESRKTKRIPVFVIARTKRKVSFNRRRRDWRTDKLRIPDE